MDRTLIKTNNNSCRSSRKSAVWFSKNHAAMAVLGSFSLSVAMLTGCQTTGFMNASLPVPPSKLNSVQRTAGLDTSRLDEVRYQSPDPSGTYEQQAGNVVSRNQLPGLPYAEDQKAVENSQVSTGKQSDRVAEVKIVGNQTIPTHQITRAINTRAGRFFDPDKLQQDVNQLWRMPEISRIKGPFLERTDAGVIVTLEVVERAAIKKVEFIGNRGIADRTLKKETGLEDGRPLDVHQIRMAKTRLEELYKEKGYPRTQVEIMEGADNGDSKVVFLIHEDEKQRIWNVNFEGNTIASDARLKHFIKSKPGILKVFGGLVKRDEIEQDVTRLTGYYRSLGFFNARIGREVSESNDGRWLTLRFIINEGPRYRVRNVSFIGNSAYTAEQLQTMVNLKPAGSEGPEFNSAKMNKDVVALRDLYGSEGFIFSKVEAEPRFLEEPGLLDIVYKIDEGKQYVAGTINVHFIGGGGITKREVVLNRLSVRPGDLINNREIQNSERRLGTSKVFATGGTTGGPPPRIVVRPPELKELQRFAERTGVSGGSGGGSLGSQGSTSRF